MFNKNIIEFIYQTIFLHSIYTFVVRSSELSKQFFKAVLATDLNKVKAWWKDELGFFSNGDQDAMVYLLLESEKYKSKMDLYDYQHFNSRYENLFIEDLHKPFVLHFTGRGPELKTVFMSLKVGLLQKDRLKK